MPLERTQSGPAERSISTVLERQSSRQSSRQRGSFTSTRLKVGATAAFRAPRTDHGSSVKQQHIQQQQQQQQQIAGTILQRRERLRVFEDGEDVTPRPLGHLMLGGSEGRRTAFDTLGQPGATGTRLSVTHQPRTSLATIASSFSSVCTLDAILQPAAGAHSDSYVSSARSVRSEVKNFDGEQDDEDVPSEFHVPRLDERDYASRDERITLRLRETETFFLFELAQLTADASSEEGALVAEANERYASLAGAARRKTVDAEAQTGTVYTKSRGTYVARRERHNRATFVNNWVMHDSYIREQSGNDTYVDEESRFKFPESNTTDESRREPEKQLAAIGAKVEYEEAARVTLRILASKLFEEPQRRFAGMLRQDPCDPELQLVYGLDLLWQHVSPKVQRRAVTTFAWNPVNRSLLAVGYGATKSHSSRDTPVDGIVLVWCAKNPTEPDRCYEFDSPISDLDWSRSRPNLLAIGFYDGVIRIVDVSKKQLAVVRQSRRKTSPSYGPHWQVQWWPIGEPLDHEQQQQQLEQLYTCNQDGRICYYSNDENFASCEILQLRRIEGKVPGVRRLHNCAGNEVAISRNAAALVMRRAPGDVYLVGTEEGSVHRCSVAQPHSHLEVFLAHDGPVYGLEFSPFCSRLLLTCGADWTARLWADGLDEPLLSYTTRMACVTDCAWSPRNATVFASCVDNEVCIWDIRRKTHRPASVTKIAPEGARLQRLEFTSSGEQLVAGDDEGNVYVHGLTGMPLPSLDESQDLLRALRGALVTKPELLARLRKLGPPFDT